MVVRNTGWLTSLGELMIMLRRACVAGLRDPPPARVFLDQLHDVGVRSLSIVGLTAVFTGMVMALQLGYFLTQFGAKIFVSRMVGLSVIAELGPVLTGLMIGGRVGAGMAAELGTMKVTEQIDALRALGTDPASYLVFPRLVALIVMMPLLTGLADFVGILGGMVLAYFDLGVSPNFYMRSLLQWLTVADIVRSLVKGVAFGVIIGAVACFNGINAKNGADGVGRATTQTVVGASITVLVADFFLTMLMLSI